MTIENGIQLKFRILFLFLFDLADLWGVGCIFVELLTGCPAFPGVKDATDQLERIFKILGTPTEATWSGVSRLPLYKPQRLTFYRTQRLGHAFPRLYDIGHAENLASKLLQLQPSCRLTAETAVKHRFFQELPAQIFQLPDGKHSTTHSNHYQSIYFLFEIQYIFF